MELIEILEKAHEKGASSESLVKLTKVFQELAIPSELAQELPPSLQFIGPRPWINAIKTLYAKGSEKGGIGHE
ncbi:hypothetical protein [Gracilinema caldarium]|uniref:Uncharacterized protein n=1 Tax=Gracilinema caldarium (strain ATCC 51460 / DSM 7334 / H1) TaxID=744872 RepID=F8F1W0_GRAC1|nr:hypothetical protein [Gracilinema caldarium]AEJ19807.1 hypothetical protein Spica_1664 [Gracilinema caldarium DSM 7334]